MRCGHRVRRGRASIYRGHVQVAVRVVDIVTGERDYVLRQHRTVLAYVVGLILGGRGIVDSVDSHRQRRRVGAVVAIADSIGHACGRALADG